MELDAQRPCDFVVCRGYGDIFRVAARGDLFVCVHQPDFVRGAGLFGDSLSFGHYCGGIDRGGDGFFVPGGFGAEDFGGAAAALVATVAGAFLCGDVYGYLPDVIGIWIGAGFAEFCACYFEGDFA
jgi:hypothetical protein